MDFCGKCGGKLKAAIKEDEPHLKCRTCGELTKPNNKVGLIKKVFQRDAKQEEMYLRIEDEKAEALGDVVRHECKNCTSMEAYFQEIKPDRFNDEQSVALYRCIRCNKVERSKTAG
ncbi:MAG: hypothetical protein KGH61_02965 [Candidatus Micrarchaeota archaeon]|nr:hypothetical protein [Candidatus Micrarchaeota archaeon]MDE1847884.1 hypothetical protein [Candidatus Micrarchaeota archaeon]MDE1864510.1 hypothetical protein [Candidatus Micrarchaeota archaeon]